MWAQRSGGRLVSWPATREPTQPAGQHPRLRGHADAVWLCQLSGEEGRLTSTLCASVLGDEAGGPRTPPAR